MVEPEFVPSSSDVSYAKEAHFLPPNAECDQNGYNGKQRDENAPGFEFDSGILLCHKKPSGLDYIVETGGGVGSVWGGVWSVIIKHGCGSVHRNYEPACQ